MIYWAMAWGDEGHGATGMCGIEQRGARAIGGDCGRPQPAAQTCGAGAHRARLRGSAFGATGGAKHRVSRPTVWRWQQRFAESGVEGLLRDKTRKPGKAPIAAETTAQVVALTCTEPPHQATHWTSRAMAKVIGISVGSRSEERRVGKECRFRGAACACKEMR